MRGNLVCVGLYKVLGCLSVLRAFPKEVVERSNCVFSMKNWRSYPFLKTRYIYNTHWSWIRSQKESVSPSFSKDAGMGILDFSYNHEGSGSSPSLDLFYTCHMPYQLNKQETWFNQGVQAHAKQGDFLCILGNMWNDQTLMHY